MPDIRIEPTQAAAESDPFRVDAYDLPMGVSGVGTFEAGDEVVVHRATTDDTFIALTEADATIDSANFTTTIASTGIYKLVKGITTGSCGASTD